MGDLRCAQRGDAGVLVEAAILEQSAQSLAEPTSALLQACNCNGVGIIAAPSKPGQGRREAGSLTAHVRPRMRLAYAGKHRLVVFARSLARQAGVHRRQNAILGPRARVKRGGACAHRKTRFLEPQSLTFSGKLPKYTIKVIEVLQTGLKRLRNRLCNRCHCGMLDFAGYPALSGLSERFSPTAYYPRAACGVYQAGMGFAEFVPGLGGIALLGRRIWLHLGY
jgi:hypothetical protein